MNPTKSKIKIAVTEDFGRKFEDMSDEAERSINRQQGARESLKAAAQQIGSLMELIDLELKEGGLSSFGEPIEVAKYAKRWMKRAIGSIDSLATKAEASRIAATGQKKGLEDAARVAHKAWEEERNKLQAYMEALEEDKPREDGRELDGHPGPTLKSKRQAEGQKEPEQEKEPEKVEKQKKAPAKKAKKAKKDTAQTPKKRLRDPKKKR